MESVVVVPERTETSGEVWLRADHVSIRYEESTKAVISGVDFQLEHGESVLFLGPSGCGKSTFAMLCAGLIPSVVEATVDGAWFRHDRLARPGGVGYVFQDADAQFCMLNVGDEIAFGLENILSDPADMDTLSRLALQRASLSLGADGLQSEHATFSGGMKQKLAIACALSTGADLLVFDEPTANLDPAATHLVFQQIAQLHGAGQTMIVIEHKFDPLLPQMDRVVLFTEQGEIYRQGPTMTVIREEWNWLQNHGVVSAWKACPFALEDEEPVDDAALQLASNGMQPNQQGDAVTLDGVSFAYQGKQVWTDITLRVPIGSVTAIVGPNGAGKTTLLQVMAGLQTPSHGRVTMFGVPAAGRRKWHTHDTLVSYCFQNPEMQFIYERVVDELANRVVQGPVPDDVANLLDRFGLTAAAQQSPYALSQGQKRRLSVAAMLREPHELYCLDEPTFGQDASTQAAIMAELERVHEQGKTVILTTHDMDLVRRYATRVIVVAEGGVLFCGDPADLFIRHDLLQRAHLLDDVTPLPPDEGAETADAMNEKSVAEFRSGRVAPLKRLNPAWHLVSILVAVMGSVGIHQLRPAAMVFLFPMALMLGLGWMHPWTLVRRYAVFALFYVFYLFTYMAYSKIPPGTTHVLHFLWMHADWYGFMAGLTLALRMLAAVGFGILFLSNTDLSAFASALSQSMRVPPKFSYGLMAGVHFMPLFQGEWQKLRLARRLRGREGSVWSRPVRYAIPILSQAIRLSERVAIAMEARGFVGPAAQSWRGRTYYKLAHVKPWDIVYDLGVPLAVLGILLWAR